MLLLIVSTDCCCLILSLLHTPSLLLSFGTEFCCTFEDALDELGEEANGADDGEEEADDNEDETVDELEFVPADGLNKIVGLELVVGERVPVSPSFVWPLEQPTWSSWPLVAGGAVAPLGPAGDCWWWRCGVIAFNMISNID